MKSQSNFREDTSAAQIHVKMIYQATVTRFWITEQQGILQLADRQRKNPKKEQKRPGLKREIGGSNKDMQILQKV